MADKMTGVSPQISATLYVNGLNSSTKTQRLAEWIYKTGGNPSAAYKEHTSQIKTNIKGKWRAEKRYSK